MKIKDTTIDSHKDFTKVALEGELDKVGLDTIRADLDKMIAESKTHNVVLDLSELTFINSEGVGYLLTIHYRLLKRDLKMILVGAKAHVKDVLEVIGMLTIVPYFETFELFEQSL
jgi:anti-anti-sigma factor